MKSDDEQKIDFIRRKLKFCNNLNSTEYLINVRLMLM